MTFERSGVSLLRRLALLALLALPATGCGGIQRDDGTTAATGQGGFSVAATRQLFSSGFEQIAEVYIEPVKISQLGMHGLQALSSIDPAFKVTRDGDMVKVQQADKPLGSFRAPADGDSRGWAAVTANVMDLGRGKSDKLGKEAPEHLYQVAFDGALADLDRFSRYSGSDAARNNRSNRDGFGGIGVTIETKEGTVKVTSVLPDTPAENAGLKSGDHITHIDGASAQAIPEKSVVTLLRGPIGTNVELKVRREGVPVFDVTLRRAKIVTQTVTYRRESGDIAYFKVLSFNRQTSETLAGLYEQAKREIGPGLRGVVLDLRNNPGGLLDQGIAVADLFLPSGRILTTRGRHPESLQLFEAAGRDIAQGKPIVVLINGASASASEIVAAALQDLGRAIVVGSGSYGKGTVQTVLRLPNDGELTLTWARFYAPSGYALQKIGVLPTICTSTSGFTVAKSMDELRGGRVDPVAAISARRTADSMTETAQLALAATCPTRNADRPQDIDLEVARMLLGDPSLISRGLRGTAVASASNGQSLDSGSRAAIVRR